MENGGEIKTLNKAESLDSETFDSFSTPIKGGGDSNGGAAETEAELRRLTAELEEGRRAQGAMAAEASRLEGEMYRLQNDLIAAESAAQSAEGEELVRRKEVEELKKALEDSEHDKTESNSTHAVESTKLKGQLEALKGKLVAAEDELAELREKNAGLEAEMGKNREGASVLAARAHEEMVELMERNAHLEGEIMKKKEIEEEDVVVVKELKNPQNWVHNGLYASAGAAVTLLAVSIYLKLQKKQ